MRGSIQKKVNKKGVSWSVVWDEPGETRRQRRKTFPSKRLAEEHLAAVVGAVYGGTYASPTKYTVAAYLDRWMEAQAGGGLAGGTLAGYDVALNRVRPLIGAVRIDKLDELKLQAMYGDLSATYAPSTLAQTHAVVRKALKQAVRWRLLARDPLEGVDAPTPPKSEAKAWSAAEASRFLAFLREGVDGRAEVADDLQQRPNLHLKDVESMLDDEGRRAAGLGHCVDPLYPLFALALWTGMREGELCALTWADVDLGAGFVAVRRHVGRTRDWKETVESGAKRGQGRRVSLGPEAVALLRPLRQAPAAWVFQRPDGSRVSCAQARMRLLKVVRALGLPEVGFHGLRHTHATMLLEAGVHPKVVAERLGHKGIAMTMDVYSHVSPRMDQAAAEAAEKRLAG
jgi:integrase